MLNLLAKAGDAGDRRSIPGSRRSAGAGNGNPLQRSCLGKPWAEEPVGLQSVGLQRVSRAEATTHTHNRFHGENHGIEVGERERQIPHH